ncbi:MAG: VOC family protein [Planctomycetota bacterium]
MTTPLWNGIYSIDHPLIAVADMERARGVYERLGFVVPPRGSHVEWGTGNWCIMFERDYLELRGILDPSRPLQGLDAHLEMNGEGLMGLAFGTNDADMSCDTLTNSGIGVRKFDHLARNFERPEGWTQPKFALCFPDEHKVLGLTHVVLCQHLTPQLLRDPSFLDHPNGATGMVGIFGQVADLEAVEKIQRAFLGDGAVTRTENKLTLRLPSDQFIELEGLAMNTQDKKSCLVAIRLAVTNLTNTRDVLKESSIPFEGTLASDVLVVSETHACGTRLEFVEI